MKVAIARRGDGYLVIRLEVPALNATDRFDLVGGDPKGKRLVSAGRGSFEVSVNEQWLGTCIADLGHLDRLVPDAVADADFHGRWVSAKGHRERKKRRDDDKRLRQGAPAAGWLCGLVFGNGDERGIHKLIFYGEPTVDCSRPLSVGWRHVSFLCPCESDLPMTLNSDNSTMRAMIMSASRTPLVEESVRRPKPSEGQVLIKVCACGVCRTDLHVVDGELRSPKAALVPGHEVVGLVAACGSKSNRFPIGTRVGVPWLGWTCGECHYCRSGRENLCAKAKFTGYTLDGGYAEYAVADERFCFLIPESYSDEHAAPLLCAGLIGYRCLSKAGDGGRLGLYGFGAAAHIVCQIAKSEGRSVFAFTKPGDEASQGFARSVGADWAGDAGTRPPEELDAAIIFAPSGPLVPDALRAVARGGVVVCGGIHMSDIPSFPYEILWEERTICSVANLTRKDGEDFFAVAARIPLRITTTSYQLNEANQALDDLRSGRLHGAAVLKPIV